MINVYARTFKKLFLGGMEIKETLVSLVFKQRASITQE